MTVTYSSPVVLLDEDNSGWEGYNFRIKFSAAQLTVSGAQVRIRFPNVNTNPWECANCFIGEAANTGDAFDFASTPTRVTVGGANSFSCPGDGGAALLSDWITFALDETKAYIISAYMGPGPSTLPSVFVNETWQFWYSDFTGTDVAGTVDVSGTWTARTYPVWLDQIEVQSSGVSLAAAATASASVSASLELDKDLAAAVAAVASASAALRAFRQLAASSSATALAAASLRVDKELGAAVLASANATASLRVAQHLAAAAAAQSSASASLSVTAGGVHLAAAATTVASVSASLRKLMELSAEAKAQAGGEATLTVTRPPPPRILNKDEATLVAMPYRVLVHREEPDFEKHKVDQAEYEFTGRSGARAFRANPNRRGAYNPDS